MKTSDQALIYVGIDRAWRQSMMGSADGYLVSVIWVWWGLSVNEHVRPEEQYYYMPRACIYGNTDSSPVAAHLDMLWYAG